MLTVKSAIAHYISFIGGPKCFISARKLFALPAIVGPATPGTPTSFGQRESGAKIHEHEPRDPPAGHLKKLPFQPSRNGPFNNGALETS